MEPISCHLAGIGQVWRGFRQILKTVSAEARWAGCASHVIGVLQCQYGRGQASLPTEVASTVESLDNSVCRIFEIRRARFVNARGQLCLC